MPAEILNRQDKVDVTDELEAEVKGAVAIALQMVMGHNNYEVDISFVDDKEIAQLNEAYRGVPQPTDVLSFPLEDPDELVADDGECVEIADCPDCPNVIPPTEYDGMYYEFAAAEEVLLGDVVISLERASGQAEDYGHSLSREVCYLTVHGVLHLLGYDHEEAEDAACMRRLEESVMNRIGLPR